VSKKDLPRLILIKAPFLFASMINLFKLSTNIRNRRGARGHPCLNPLEGLKNLDAKPIIKTKNVTPCFPQLVINNKIGLPC
jgi:hypothetical protein